MRQAEIPPMTTTRFSQLLSGVRILDCTRNIAGPVATMLAAEMGATVIKVEPPGGDEMRKWPPFSSEGDSVYFASCNRGKRSIVLDLKTEQGRSLFLNLMGSSDVVVENFRPGTLEKLGLGWHHAKQAHPKLVWVSVSGYGRSGPRATAPAYDSMMQAFVGIMGITGEAGRPPVRCGGSPIDIATAYLAWGAIMSGVFAVAKDGRGLLLEVSLMESAVGFMHAYMQAALMELPMPGRLGSETMGIYPVGAFRTAGDGYCLLQVSNDHQWRRFCEVLATPELVADARFSDNPSRVRNRDSLRTLIQQHLLQKPAREWEEVLTVAGVPASEVRGLQAVAADEQILARRMVKPALLPSGREFATWGVPIKVDEQTESPMLTVPGLDQHREEILAELQQATNG
jgi:formyl-CoA transferase/CoA:oxalate CoA-transferase